MLDFVLLSGLIVFVIAVNRWLKTATEDHEKNVDNDRNGNNITMLIPFVLVLCASCEGVPNSALAQNNPNDTAKVVADEPYITQEEIDNLTDAEIDSTGKCFSASAYDGMKLFMRNCNVCHPAAEKGKGPSLVDMNYLPDWLIHFQVRTGRGEMPRFTKEQISNEQVKHIVLFIRSLRGDKKETAQASQ